jgi:glycosyltransferase involved in cell wall biosynthesis
LHIGFLTLESPFDATKGGGIAAYLRALIPALGRAGHRVTVLTNAQQASGPAVCDEAVREIRVRLPSLHWYLSKLPLVGDALALPVRQIEWSLKFSQAARGSLTKDPVDVLESPALGALMLARHPIAPLVIRLHGSDYVFRKYTGQPLHQGTRWNHRLEQAVWRRGRALTAPSRFQAAEVTAEMHWPCDRVRVVANPIDPQLLAEAIRAGEETERQRSCPLVLYTGRLALVKGTVPLLEAIRIVRAWELSARFVLAGPWQMPGQPEDHGLEKKTDTRQGTVSWLGHVPWQELVDLYRQADVFVMPSYYESFGISCLEAMAFGLPVVATRAGGLPEVVQDGVTGVLVAPGDAHALADAITHLLRDPELRRRLGNQGRERVLAEFTADRVARETLRVYETVQSDSAR